MLTVKKLIEELKKFNDEDTVHVIYLAETNGTLKEGDGDVVPISFASSGVILPNGHREPTLHISLFDDEAMEETLHDEDVGS